MPFARTTPFREELARCFPERPFEVEFWDGTRLPATQSNGGGPHFTVRSRALTGLAWIGSLFW